MTALQLVQLALAVVTLGGVLVAAGRWGGRKDRGEENITEDQKRAREESRVAIQETRSAVGSLKGEMAEGFKRVEEQLRPLNEWHAQRDRIEGDLAAIKKDLSEARLQLAGIVPRVEAIERAQRNGMERPRSRKTS